MYDIKFRIWDHAEKRMREDISIPLLYEAYKNDAALTLNDVFSRPLGVDFMQYTGLKDKAGTGVFEGDILLYSGKDSCGHKVKDRKIAVEYEPRRCQYNIGGDWGYTGESFMQLYKFEVIGNIHENPGLLDANGV